MTRFRSDSRTSVITGSCIDRNLTTGATDTPRTGSVSLAAPTRWMYDEVTRSYTRRSKAGELIFNPMSSFNESQQFIPADVWKQKSHPNGDVWKWEATGFMWGSPPSYDEFKALPDVAAKIAWCKANAITKAYAGVGTPDVAVLTELVELKETLSFLASPFKKMVRVTRLVTSKINTWNRRKAAHEAALQRYLGKSQKFRDKHPPPKKPEFPKFKLSGITASDVASAWLAYRYAIMPLIYTWQDVQSLLEKRSKAPPVRVSARGKVREIVRVNQSTTPAVFSSKTGATRESWDTTAEIKITSRAMVLYRPLVSLSDQLGLQLNRVPAALYEGIPLSFVADWFWTGSKYYDALTAECRALEILGATVSTRVECNAQRHLNFTAADSSTTAYGGHTMYTSSSVLKERANATLADIRVQWELDMNLKRYVDALALSYTMLATAIGKKRK